MEFIMIFYRLSRVIICCDPVRSHELRKTEQLKEGCPASLPVLLRLLVAFHEVTPLYQVVSHHQSGARKHSIAEPDILGGSNSKGFW